MTTQLAFDRGTLRLHGLRDSHSHPQVIWDERTGCHRAPAHRYRELRGHPDCEDLLAPPLTTASGPWRTPPLRPYQERAVEAWDARGRRGLVVLPTGAGKTRVALACIARAAITTAILCPTRALLSEWSRALREVYEGPIGVVGDGDVRVEPVTIFTFESAYRRFDELGDRFGMLVVDEAHHFGSGLRTEALEMSPAPLRLGLTATPPEPYTEQAARLEDLLGPLVFELALGDLIGTHLADLDVERIPVELDERERLAYARLHEPFDRRMRAWFRLNPRGDYAACLRSIASSRAGKQLLADEHRAVSLAAFPSGKRRLVGRLLARHRNDKTIVFTSVAEHAYTVARDHLAPVITSETSRVEREEILLAFREGRVRCIVSARVLNEGIDVPDASVAIVVAGGLGVRELVQRIGRILRPSPGKRAKAYELFTTETIDHKRSRARWRTLAAHRSALAARL